MSGTELPWEAGLPRGQGETPARWESGRTWAPSASPIRSVAVRRSDILDAALSAAGESPSSTSGEVGVVLGVLFAQATLDASGKVQWTAHCEGSWIPYTDGEALARFMPPLVFRRLSDQQQLALFHRAGNLTSFDEIAERDEFSSASEAIHHFYQAHQKIIDALRSHESEPVKLLGLPAGSQEPADRVLAQRRGSLLTSDELSLLQAGAGVDQELLFLLDWEFVGGCTRPGSLEVQEALLDSWIHRLAESGGRTRGSLYPDDFDLDHAEWFSSPERVDPADPLKCADSRDLREMLLRFGRSFAGLSLRAAYGLGAWQSSWERTVGEFRVRVRCVTLLRGLQPETEVMELVAPLSSMPFRAMASDPRTREELLTACRPHRFWSHLGVRNQDPGVDDRFFWDTLLFTFEIFWRLRQWNLELLDADRTHGVMGVDVPAVTQLSRFLPDGHVCRFILGIEVLTTSPRRVQDRHVEDPRHSYRIPTPIEGGEGLVSPADFSALAEQRRAELVSSLEESRAQMVSELKQYADQFVGRAFVTVEESRGLVSDLHALAARAGVRLIDPSNNEPSTLRVTTPRGCPSGGYFQFQTTRKIDGKLRTSKSHKAFPNCNFE